jgi:hypothetical protein
MVSPLNHLTRLIARENFIILSRRESNKSLVISSYSKFISLTESKWLGSECSLPCSQQPTTGPYLSQMCPVHTFPTCFHKTPSDTDLPSTPRSSEWPLPFRFSDQIFVRISHITHACYVPHPSHLPWYDRPTNIWWSYIHACQFYQFFDAPSYYKNCKEASRRERIMYHVMLCVVPHIQTDPHVGASWNTNYIWTVDLLAGQGHLLTISFQKACAWISTSRISCHLMVASCKHKPQFSYIAVGVVVTTSSGRMLTQVGILFR